MASANEENSNNINLQANSVTIDNVDTKNSVGCNVLADSEIQNENVTNIILLNNDDENILESVVSGSGETKSVTIEDWAAVKNAIESAANGDTVYLNGTIYRATNKDTQIIVNKNITIHGGFKDNQSFVSTLDMNEAKRIMLIKSGCVVNIMNVNFLNGSSSSGGAIYGENNVKLAIINCDFTENYGGYRDRGGVIYLDDYCNLSVFNSKFTNNRARYGGAIYGRNNVAINIINCDFTDNYADYSGGVISGGNNVAINIINCNFNDNYGGWIGGGVIYLGDYCNLSVNNSKFAENNGQYGGAIKLGSYSNLSVNNSDFTNNSNDYGINGGAICVDNNVNIIIKNCNFTNNHKKGAHEGGAVYGENNVNLIIKNCNFTNNYCNEYGGGIRLYNNCNLSIYNSKFTKNHGNWGGAIYMLNNGLLVVLNSEFTNNTSGNPGQSIYIQNSILVYIESSKFNMHRVLSSGTLYCGGSNKNVTVSNCEFTTSDKYSNGHAIYVNNANCSISNSKFNINAKEDYYYHYAYIIYVSGRSILDLSNNNITINGSMGIPIWVSKNTDVVSKTQLTWSNNFTTGYNSSIWIKLWLFDDNNNLIEVEGGINATIENTNIKMKLERHYKRYTGRYTPDFIGVRLINGSMFSNVTPSVYVIVYKQPSVMNITGVPGVFNATIIVNLNTDGMVNLTIDNRNFTVEVKNGTGSVFVPNLKPATYVIDGVFGGNYYYDGTDATGSVTIVKLVPTADMKINVSGPNATIKVFTNANGTLNISVDGTTHVVPIVNGSAVLTLTNLTDGKYNVSVIYPGNDYYYNFTLSGDFKIAGKILIITAEPVSEFFGDNKCLFINATDGEGNPVEGIFVEFVINGVYYNRTTNSDGLGIKPIDLPIGFYDFDVCFNGDSDYAPITVSSNITIESTIVSENMVKIYGDGTPFSVTFLDKYGNPLEGSIASFNIIGIFYHEATDVSGGVHLNIDFNPGTYIATASNPVTGELRSFNLTFLPNMEANDIVKYFRNGTQYNIKLLGKHGNGAPVGSKVLLNINGVSYERTTIDASGRVKLNINLLPGKYVLTAAYNGLLMSNNITVLSTIESKDLDTSTNDRKPFVAILLDDHGIPAAGVKATFNIHGIFYHGVSDANGMIKLNINLQPGKYIITDYYKELAKSNTIIVRDGTEVESVI